MAAQADGTAELCGSADAEGAGANAALDRLAGLVEWYRFEKLIGHLRDEGRARSTRLVRCWCCFDAVLLQSLYGLSGANSRKRWATGCRSALAGLSLEDATPDHTVLNRFQNQLVEQGLLEKLFGELDRQLENAGVILKRGTMLDATLIQAVSASSQEDRPSNDPRRPVHQAARQSGTTFGYKGPCRCRRRIRLDPHGTDHTGQHQRHDTGGRFDPRR